MVTLKELVNRQFLTQENDIDLIVEWFKENDMSLQGIEFISKLAKNEISDIKHKQGVMMGNLNMYAGNETLIKLFGIKNGCKFDRVVRLFIMGYDLEKEYPMLVDWLREFVPQQKEPTIFWQPFKEYLHKLNIYFSNEVKDE